MTAPPEDREFAALARRVAQGAGLALEAYKDRCVRRRIAARMRACGVHTYADYRTLLEQNPAELDRLADALTINVTRFYRNVETWELLRSRVLPAVCERTGGGLRAWSAGCASGEEAYTLAIAVADLHRRRGRPEDLERLSVDATDIDRMSLARATDATYRGETLSDLPGELLARYLEPGLGGYRVADPVRRRVQVGRHDLTRDPLPRRAYHLILCRNVVIYFDRATQERLFLAFTDALEPGGYLVLGRVETLLGPARERLALEHPRERVYRRPL